MENTLTLWDIDGNMVNVYNHHTPSYQKAIEQVYNVSVPGQEIERNYGLPAREVVAIPLRARGIAEDSIQTNMAKVFSVYASELERRIKEDSSASSVILPGVVPLLDKLNALNIPMGIVTGNIKEAGEAILKGCGLYDYFDAKINSYGGECAQRSQIVADAIYSAKAHGIISDGARILVFGDTPSDVEAAKRNNCVSVGVIKNSNEPDSSPNGTVYAKRKLLLECSDPDFLFDDYTDLDSIISKLNLKK